MARPRIPLPAHAYLPGMTARHPEGCFDGLKGGLEPGMNWGRIAASPAWRNGIALLRHGYYWEAHEVLEAVWMHTAPDTAERALVQGVIQIANARLKLAMGRAKAAARIAGMAADHLKAAEALDRGGATNPARRLAMRCLARLVGGFGGNEYGNILHKSSMQECDGEINH